MLAHVVPVLSGATDPELLSREGPAGLLVTYLTDGVAVAQRSTPVSLEAMDATAWKHLEAHPAEPRAVIVDRGQPRLSPEPLGLWALCEADGADGARLLTEGQRRRLFEVVGAGPYRVSLARRELALVAPLLDPLAVALLETVEAGPEDRRALRPPRTGRAKRIAQRGRGAGRFVLHPDGTLQRIAPAA
jgi:hypothetical protein